MNKQGLTISQKKVDGVQVITVDSIKWGKEKTLINFKKILGL
jgi:hypothetical protein